MNSLYIARESMIHRLDPRTKILFVLFIVISTFLFKDPAMQLILLFGMFPLILLSKLVKQYFISMQFLMLFVVLIMTIHGIYNPIGETPVFEIFGGLTFKYESLVYASVMSFRILVIGTAAVLFVMTTHPSDLAIALMKWKVSHSIAFMFLSTFQIIPIIAREAKIVMEAQQARCLDVKANIFERVKHLVPLFAPLFIITFVKVHQLSYVLECRAFSRNGVKTSLRETKISSLDYMFISGMLVLLLTELYLSFAQKISLTTSNLLVSSLFAVWAVFFIVIVKFLFKKVSVFIGG
ncbi:energy-coupling factor transporter transmembrane component T family protein [Neobacillus sedimentimangrovi]|uniref:energy-coupling factor transporter transmembrane component T family protein n=1 Tax=Neobacillus sedimentimangrovi TaxID=2699460 RepID=UPI0013D14882|nr:energy-coupling factor transporter transmembrane component T [Neobacillus sedimentimangrovi]